VGQAAAAACRLPGNGDVVRIAAKGRDVSLHPGKGRHLIQETEVAAVVVTALGCQFRVGEPGEQVKAVGDADKDNSAAGQPFPVKFHFGGVAALICPTVDPDHHGKLLLGGFGGRPDIEIQTVFSHGDGRIHMPLLGIKCLRV